MSTLGLATCDLPRRKKGAENASGNSDHGICCRHGRERRCHALIPPSQCKIPTFEVSKEMRVGCHHHPQLMNDSRSAATESSERRRTTFSKKFQIPIHCAIDPTTPFSNGQREGGPNESSKLSRYGRKMHDGDTSYVRCCHQNYPERMAGSLACRTEKAGKSAYRLENILQQDLRITNPNWVCRRSTPQKTLNIKTATLL